MLNVLGLKNLQYNTIRKKYHWVVHEIFYAPLVVRKNKKVGNPCTRPRLLRLHIGFQKSKVQKKCFYVFQIQILPPVEEEESDDTGVQKVKLK
jgi:hypothetical protein